MIETLLTHPIVLELIEKGFELRVRKSGVLVDGFYKSGSIELVLNNENELIAKSRYEQEDVIESFEDLVSLNYEWWQKSKNRNDHWLNPTKQWGELMVELGLVKMRVERVVHYD